MLNQLLNIGRAFDWITPASAILQDFLNGPSSHFGIIAQAGWTRAQIREILTSHGVRVWGLMYNLSGDMLMFAVPKTQGKWAYYLLKREGVPILYAPAEVVKAAERHSKRKTNAGTLLDPVFDFLDRLTDDNL
jgi:hypothetical protein